VTLQLQDLAAEAVRQSVAGIDADVGADGQSRLPVDAVYDTT